MDSSPKPKEKLICISCRYETDYLGTYAKPPVCPHCKNLLSFKESGAVSAEEVESIPWVSHLLKLAGVLFLFFAFNLMLRHFHTYDYRSLVMQEARIGEKFYGGKSRSKIAADWLRMPYSFQNYWAHNFHSRTAVMINEEHWYAYKGSRNGQLEVEYFYSDSKGKKSSHIVPLKLAGNTALLDIPAIPYVSKSRRTRLKLVQDSSGSRIRIFSA